MPNRSDFTAASGYVHRAEALYARMNDVRVQALRVQTLGRVGLARGERIAARHARAALASYEQVRRASGAARSRDRLARIGRPANG